MSYRISIAICAYNAEKNIEQLIGDVIAQEMSSQFSLERIIVHSDCSSDRTENIASAIPDARIRVVRPQSRRGFAGTVKYLCTSFEGDVLVLLNDDIAIPHIGYIDGLCRAVTGHPSLGLVSGDILPFAPRSFVERALVSSTKAYRYMRSRMKNKHNKFTCDGKVLALGNSFVRAIKFPDAFEAMGNVDSFLYLECLTKGFRYAFYEEGVAWYRMPSTMKDYVAWVSRNDGNYYLMKKYFGDITRREYQKPMALYAYAMLREFFKNPIGSLFIIMIKPFILLKARRMRASLSPFWEVISTTKDLKRPPVDKLPKE